MGRRLLTLALLCAPAATGVVPTVSVSEAARTTERLQQHVMVEHAGHAHAGHAHAALGDDDDKRPARGAADATRNYFGDYLLVRDSTVRRWEDRTQQPIRVWVQPGRALVGWDDRFPSMVADAFREWERVGLPVRFQLVKDSVGAEVRVLWAEKLSMDESGRTVWWSTPSGFIRRAHVTLATHASDGIVQHPRALRAVALHEIGHVLG
nr:hypothetical protein [Gemmatimonadaceae bacterium]